MTTRRLEDLPPDLNKQISRDFNGKKYYRMGTPTRAIVAAGIKALYGTPFRYNNHKISVKKSDLIALDA